MTKFRTLFAGLVGTLACASAHSADMPGTWTPPPSAAPRYAELLSGWYLRVDGGYSWNEVGSIQSSTPVTRALYRNAPNVTAGFGYKYQWMRFDLTIDRGFPSSFNGTTAAPGVQPQYTAKLGWLAALGNAYVDFGTWWGFTPYAGAGIGVTRLHSAHYVDNGLPPHAVSPQSQMTNFSWAAMAGVAFQVAPNWMIDVGYRRLELGKVPMTTGAGIPTDFTTIQSVSVQQVRVGVRFLFD